MNSIQIIHPYKSRGVWVFDDDRKELVREPFVAGSDEIIDRLVRLIPNAQMGFTLYFSTTPFPRHTITLEWMREDNGGNWYHCPQFDMTGWLCPALLKYFKRAPSELYIRAIQSMKEMK